MNIKIRFGLYTLFLVLFFTSCETYPDYDDYVTEQLVTITGYDESANFEDYNTFSVYDSIVIINDKSVLKVKVSSRPELQKLFNDVKSNVADLGYTYQEGNNADLGVIITLMETTTVVVSNPWWWYGYCYWYFWDCGYYPYYPYPYPVVVGEYSTGTVTMDMFDLKRQSGTMQPVVWTGVVRGLVTGDHTDTEISSAISECFLQTIPFQNK